MAVVYHLFRPGEAFEVTVKALTPRARPQVPSVTGLWAAAQWPEREVMEMFGITLTGHPDPRHLLLPEDWQGFPLRKDYAYPLDHPYLRPDPLHDNPQQVLGREGAAEPGRGGEPS
jgi:NADH-quinone oxidoreductase subunit C